MVQNDLFPGAAPTAAPVDHSDSLTLARVELMQNINDGVKCPCCSQLAKVYRRRIYAVMANDLIELWKLGHNRQFRQGGIVGDGFKLYFHIRKFAAVGGDFAKLRFWGLVEEGINGDSKKRTSGLWRITDKGRLFVQNQITVPRYCFIYNGEPLYFSAETASIIEALGKKFDYPEIMRGWI